MFLLLGVLLQRREIPRTSPLWRAGVDFCSNEPSYLSFFGVIPSWGEEVMPARGGVWWLLKLMVFVARLSCRFCKEGGQIYCDIPRLFVWVFFFFPLAITFNEGPRGIFDFCMSSLLSACCWKMELEAVDGLHKKANAS